MSCSRQFISISPAPTSRLQLLSPQKNLHKPWAWHGVTIWPDVKLKPRAYQCAKGLQKYCNCHTNCAKICLQVFALYFQKLCNPLNFRKLWNSLKFIKLQSQTESWLAHRYNRKVKINQLNFYVLKKSQMLPLPISLWAFLKASKDPLCSWMTRGTYHFHALYVGFIFTSISVARALTHVQVMFDHADLISDRRENDCTIPKKGLRFLFRMNKHRNLESRRIAPSRCNPLPLRMKPPKEEVRVRIC